MQIISVCLSGVREKSVTSIAPSVTHVLTHECYLCPDWAPDRVTLSIGQRFNPTKGITADALSNAHHECLSSDHLSVPLPRIRSIPHIRTNGLSALFPDGKKMNTQHPKNTAAVFERPTMARNLTLLLLALAAGGQIFAAGPAPVDLRSTAPFAILSGAGITSTGGGTINGNVGASPIAGSAIGVTCAQVNGTIYAVDASGPACAVIDPTLLTAAKGDLTTAYNDAAGRSPTPTGPNLNPGLIPGSGNIGGMNLAPGLYKFTTTALITGSDVTLTGGPGDVLVF